MIYFIKQAKTNMVKIGYTDNYETLDNRIKILQTGNPGKLSVIGTVAGDKSTERLLHALFNDGYIHGEWFEMTSDQIYTLSQFEHDLNHTVEQLKVIDFTKNEDLMAVHGKVMNAVHNS